MNTKLRIPVGAALVLALVPTLGGAAHAADATVGDIIVRLDDPDSSVRLTIDEGRTDLEVTRSSLSLAAADAFCQGDGCEYTLNHLVVAFQDFTVDAQIEDEDAHFAVADPVAIISGPLRVRRDGAVTVIPKGTPADVSAYVSGGSSDHSLPPGTRRNRTALPEDIVLDLDADKEIATLDGAFDFTLKVNGVTVPARASFSAANGSLFVNLPPTASAGPPQHVECPGPVTLDGSRSSDRQRDIVSYYWEADTGEAVDADRAVAGLFLGTGRHVVRLTVTDSHLARSTATTVVDVSDTTGPELTFVPPDLTLSSCRRPALGTARAIDNCGGTPVVTSDAPEVFPLGRTTVTWSARDAAGNLTTATQVVTAVLADDASCCPAGTRVLVGTPGSDRLIGSSGRDCILGLGGDDRIEGGGGSDFVSGGAGSDQITGGGENNYIWGGGGDDVIDGQGGDDFIDGGSGTDTCSGGNGVNALASCEVAAHCTASCCASATCGVVSMPAPTSCPASFSPDGCLTHVQGTQVMLFGHRWECTSGNCANCATFAGCAPGASGCPWGVVWTDRGTCR
jgi:hypothetical protein